MNEGISLEPESAGIEDNAPGSVSCGAILDVRRNGSDVPAIDRCPSVHHGAASCFEDSISCFCSHSSLSLDTRMSPRGGGNLVRRPDSTAMTAFRACSKKPSPMRHVVARVDCISMLGRSHALFSSLLN